MFTFRWQALTGAIRDAWPLWLALGGIGFAFVLGWRFSADASARIRYAGTLLQVLGLATVAIGLREVRRSFGRPSLLQKVLAWFRQIAVAFRTPKPITVQATAGAVGIASAAGRVVVGAGPGASLEDRVATLEANLNRLRTEVDAKDNKLRTELVTVRDALKQEQRARETESRRTAEKLEELAVGGLHLEFVGLTWLFLGVVGASIPGEIAKVLQIMKPLWGTLWTGV